MNTCEATPSAAQEIRIQSLGTPEIDSPLSRNLATAGERRVVFTAVSYTHLTLPTTPYV